MSKKSQKKRFGTIAVEKGLITPKQLIAAIKIQVMGDIKEGKHRPIGYILFLQGLITIPQIEKILDST
jgi:hypothetical protein